MCINEKKNVEIIKRLKSQNIDYFKLYKQIKENCINFKMTRSNKVSIYGMFIPDEIINYTIGGKYEGKLTDNEKNIDFKYYFDSENRVILTERYYQNVKNPGELIFYFYKESDIEFVLINIKRKKIDMVGVFEYDERRKLVKFLEGRVPVNTSDFLSYKETLFSYLSDSYVMNITSYMIMSDKVWKKSGTVTLPLHP